MGLSKEEIEKVAILARLSLNDKEKEKLAEQLDSILKNFEQLNQLDTSQVEPMAHVLPVQNVWREDHVTNGPPSEIIFQNAPQQEGHLYQVPPVIE